MTDLWKTREKMIDDIRDGKTSFIQTSELNKILEQARASERKSCVDGVAFRQIEADIRTDERKIITEKLNRQWSVLLELQKQRMEKASESLGGATPSSADSEGTPKPEKPKKARRRNGYARRL